MVIELDNLLGTEGQIEVIVLSGSILFADVGGQKRQVPRQGGVSFCSVDIYFDSYLDTL